MSAEPAARERMIAECMRVGGMDREAASVLTDIGKHAFEESFATARRIVETAPEGLQLAALASVLASYATLMRDKFPVHWAAFVATEPGIEVATVITLPDGSKS